MDGDAPAALHFNTDDLPDRDRLPPVQKRDARAARRLAILREIENRSSDPDLSAAQVASLFGVTPRYVHLLLEETGKSFTHHVLQRRLAKAAALLHDHGWGGRRIADVALEAGFADLSYFNRAFRRHFGVTPSDMREIARSRSVDGEPGVREQS
jgi:AraC-like DNA-binding protein